MCSQLLGSYMERMTKLGDISAWTKPQTSLGLSVGLVWHQAIHRYCKCHTDRALRTHSVSSALRARLPRQLLLFTMSDLSWCHTATSIVCEWPCLSLLQPCRKRKPEQGKTIQLNLTIELFPALVFDIDNQGQFWRLSGKNCHELLLRDLSEY